MSSRSSGSVFRRRAVIIHRSVRLTVGPLAATSVAFLATVLGVVLTGSLDTPPLRGILARAGVWVVRYEAELGSLIAEERYWQEAGSVSSGFSAAPAPGRQGAGTVPPAVPQTRELVSEFLMLQLPGSPGQWAGFRDVYRVDGRAVRDRKLRFDTMALRQSPTDTLEYWRALNQESARYNIGPVARTVNVPTVSLVVLRTREQPRFVFRTADAHDHQADVDTVVVAYEERTTPTLIADPSGANIFSSGRLWVTSAEGQVVRTELVMRLQPELPPIGTLTVQYGRDERLDTWVPLQMTEVYFARGVRVQCAATYSNYRRFETGARMVPQNPN